MDHDRPRKRRSSLLLLVPVAVLSLSPARADGPEGIGETPGGGATAAVPSSGSGSTRARGGSAPTRPRAGTERPVDGTAGGAPARARVVEAYHHGLHRPEAGPGEPAILSVSCYRTEDGAFEVLVLEGRRSPPAPGGAAGAPGLQARLVDRVELGRSAGWDFTQVEFERAGAGHRVSVFAKGRRSARSSYVWDVVGKTTRFSVRAHPGCEQLLSDEPATILAELERHVSNGFATDGDRCPGYEAWKAARRR